MKKILDNQVLALAAVVNCAELVSDIAVDGECDRVQRGVMLESIFSLDADSIDGIYGGRTNLIPGLQSLVNQFQPNKKLRADVAQYQMGLIQLQFQLMKNADAQSALRRGVKQIDGFREMSGNSIDGVIVNRLSTLYQDTLSHLKPRIIIRGNAANLAAQDKADSVRALLMAGVRAAVLWRQAGGSRWSLLLGRRATIQTARHMVETLEPNSHNDEDN